MSKSNLSPQSVLLLVIFVVILIAFGVYYYRYVSVREEYLTTRNLELLTRVGNEIQSRLEGVSVAIQPGLQEVIEKHKYATSIDTLRLDELAKYPTMIPDIHKIQIETIHDTTGQWKDTVKGKPNIALNSSSDSVLFVSMSSANDKIFLTVNYVRRLRGRIWVRLIVQLTGIEDVLTSLKNEDVFDEVFFAKNDGSVVVQRPSEMHSIVRIDSIYQEDGKGVPFKSFSQSDRVASYATGGENHQLFIHPIATPVFSGLNRSPIPAESWVVCGLLKSRSFREESLKIPRNYVIVLGLVIIVLVLSWPILKLRFMGRYDKIRVFDVIFVTLSLTFGAALVTMIFLDVLTAEQLDNELDGQLQGLAESLDTNFKSELKSVAKTLDTLGSLYAETGKLAIPSASGNILRSPGPAGYLFFDQVHWSDEHGQQVVKKTTKDYIPDLTSIEDRDYFQGAKHDLLLHAVDSEAFSLQAVFAKSTGEFSVSLARPLKDFNQRKLIPVIDFRPLTLVNPVIPDGFGFCIVDNDGKVLFHSKSDHNLKENFFSEIDNPNEFRASMRARSKELLTGDYWGKPHRFYVMPMKDLPWHIVAFFEVENIRLVHMEILSVALLLFLVYVAPYLLLLLVVLFLPGNHAGWAWPDESRRWMYYKLMAFFVIVIALFAVQFYKWQDVVSVFGTTILLPQIGLLFTYLAVTSRWINRPVGGYFPSVLKKTLIVFVFHSAIVACMTWAIFKIRSEMYPAFVVGVSSYFVGLLMLATKEQGLSQSHWFLTDARERLRRVYRFLNGLWPRFADVFTITAVTVILLGVVLPSAVFFRLAYYSQIKYYYRNELLCLDYSLEARTKRILKEYSDIKISKENSIISTRIKDTRDQYYHIFYNTSPASFPGKLPQDSSYALFDTLLIPTFMPPYNGLPMKAKSLSSGPSDSSYEWGRNQDGKFIMRRVHPLTALSVPSQPDTLTLVSDSKPFARILLDRSHPQLITILVIVAALLILLYNLLRFVVVEIFLVNIDPLMRLRKKNDSKKANRSAEQRILQDECFHGPLFQYRDEFVHIAEKITSEQKIDELAFDEIFALVHREADGYYRAIWTMCSVEERFVLSRFSEDWFINSENGPAIVSLLDRGLLVRSPDFRLFNKTFAAYVKDEAAHSEIVPQEEAKKVKGKGLLRGALLVVLILLVFFLFGTQREVYNSTITFISAAAALLPALFRVLGSFGGGRGGATQDR